MPDVKQNSYLEKKLSAVKNPDSIFLHRYWAIKFVVVDKLVSEIRKNISKNSRSEASDIKDMFNRIEELSNSFWDFVYKLSPRLAALDFKPEKWREVNDTPDRKSYYAHRKAVGVFIPRHEEVARIAMAVKLIGERMQEKRHTASFEELEALSEEQARLVKRFAEVFSDIAIRIDAPDDIKAQLKIKTNGKNN